MVGLIVLLGLICVSVVIVAVMTYVPKYFPPCEGCVAADRVIAEGMSQGYNTFGRCPTHGRRG